MVREPLHPKGDPEYRPETDPSHPKYRPDFDPRVNNPRRIVIAGAVLILAVAVACESRNADTGLYGMQNPGEPRHDVVATAETPIDPLMLDDSLRVSPGSKAVAAEAA